MKDEAAWAEGRDARKEAWHAFESATKKRKVEDGEGGVAAVDAAKYGAAAQGSDAGMDYKRKWR
jgi:hypothetical protein